MILFGIDPSLSSTGVAILNTEALTIQMGALPTTDKKKFNTYDNFERMAWVETMIDTLILSYEPSKLFFEELMQRPLGIPGIKVDFILKYNLLYKKYKIPFETIPCSRDKSWFKVLGAKSTKEKFAEVIQPYCDFSITKKDYDATDATGIVLAGAKNNGWFDGDLSKLTYSKETF